MLDSTPQWMDLCWLPTPELIGAGALELSRLRLRLGPSVNIPLTPMFKHCQDINTRAVTSDTPSSTWSEQSQDGLRIFCVGLGIIFSTRTQLTFVPSIVALIFREIWKIHYSIMPTRIRAKGLFAGKRIWGYIIQEVFFHLKIQSFDSKFKHLSLPTLEHLAE